jgi:hypothetical protein
MKSAPAGLKGLGATMNPYSKTIVGTTKMLGLMKFMVVIPKQIINA